MVTYRRSKAARTTNGLDSPGGPPGQPLRRPRLAITQPNPSTILHCTVPKHRTAQAGDGMHAEQRKHIVPTGMQPQIMAPYGKLSKHSPRAQGRERDSQNRRNDVKKIGGPPGTERRKSPPERLQKATWGRSVAKTTPKDTGQTGSPVHRSARTQQRSQVLS